MPVDIGACALVTRDVPAYAIVGGVPARVIRYRFNQADVRALLNLRWWDLPDDEVRELAPLLMSGDVHALVHACE